MGGGLLGLMTLEEHVSSEGSSGRLLKRFAVVVFRRQAIKPRPPFLRDLTARLRCVKVISYLYRSWLLGLPSRLVNRRLRLGVCCSLAPPRGHV
ncbi:hypothetical protein EVAR_4660_1 [Eumeta japonica]|uniref:Uncharacterized protein n=1 Tax=Eumeta variegata TaxID=151549 RepID=A0A4C1Y9T5_EUMVA|nr:hypothetical protein EVAR_4660_1 [Eumeta japonica]